MVGFLMNNQDYEIQANNQIAVLLSEFDADYVMGIIEDTLNQVFTQFDMIPRPNIVQSFENTFKELYSIYPTDIDNINQLRVETYQTIIRFICEKFNLRFIQTDAIDLYTIAFFLYDFFVAKLNIYMVQFYVKHLLAEKDNIISNLQIEGIKKNDPNMSYNRLAFGNDETLALIATYLPTILHQFAASNQVLDHTVYSYIYGQQTEIISIFESSVSPNVSLFQRFNSLLFDPALYGPIITYIRLQFQQTVSNVDTNPISAANMS